MAGYKPYQQTNLVGLEYLPSKWEVKKIKHLFSLGRGRVISQEELEEDGIYPVYSSQTNNNGCLGHINTYDFDCKQITWTTDGANAGTVFLREGKHNCTNVCGTLYTDSIRVSLPFFLYCLKYVTQFHKRPDTNGAKIMNNEMAEICIPSPSYREQLQISSFLDHETAKIDNLIEKQQQLIELLKEKRQAVISHAVTKGLNPDVPMKDSGVEWLGEVPEHWLCTKIKYIALLTPKKSSSNFKENDECTFIPMEKLKRNSLVTDEIKFTKEVANGYTYFEDNDLLLAKVTPCFENKNIAIAHELVNGIGFGSTEIYVLRPTKKVRVHYLLYRLQEDVFIQVATGAMTGAGGLKRVPSDFLLNYPIAIPPISEISAIADYLNEKDASYDLVENKARQGVQLLKERRTALISAAVTGKIDVRDWTAPAPQQQKAKLSEEALA
jgi:type I restriction enzyme S subunit